MLCIAGAEQQSAGAVAPQHGHRLRGQGALLADQRHESEQPGNAAPRAAQILTLRVPAVRLPRAHLPGHLPRLPETRRPAEARQVSRSRTQIQR